MHAPKRIVVNPNLFSQNFTTKWSPKSSERVVLVSDYDNNLKSGYFYDTDRGLNNINDCVHAKVVGPEVAHDDMSFAKVNLPGGLIGLPQGSWSSEYSTYQFVYTRQYWWHSYVEIPRLGVKRPVLYVFKFEFRIQMRGILDYRYWSVRIIAIATYSDPDLDANSRAKTHSCLVSFNCPANSPVTVSRTWENKGDFSLPVGYMVPGTMIPYRASTERLAIDQMDDAMLNNIGAIMNYFDIGHGSSGGWEATTVPQGSLLPIYGSGLFMFNEDIMIVDGISDLVSRNPNVYWRNWLVQHAYLAAIQSVPTLSDNSISNIIEIVGFIKALVIDHEINIPTRLNDLWLAYRYTYNTGKSDIEDAISFMKRYVDLGGLNRSIKCRGIASTAVMGVDVTCRCTLDITPTDLGNVSKIWRALENYGLTPDFYVIWDMIPYSFIVDWFIPIGDLLSVVDAERRFSGSRYTISNVCFSLSYRRSIDGYDYKLYSRWRADPLESFNLFYWFDKPKVDSKVTMYRILDTVSLVIGG
jgi:hypothetical protein